MHHVTVRVLRVVRSAAEGASKFDLRDWCDRPSKAEKLRIERALSFLAPVCAGLDRAGCKTTVIKSLDHWPDLGSDLDLYTSGDPQTVFARNDFRIQSRDGSKKLGRPSG